MITKSMRNASLHVDSGGASSGVPDRRPAQKQPASSTVLT